MGSFVNEEAGQIVDINPFLHHLWDNRNKNLKGDIIHHPSDCRTINFMLLPSYTTPIGKLV
jgi:hypothetical protein